MAANDTRERILDAAEKLFADRGLHDVSLRELAAAAEMRVSLLQYHFASKEELYYAVFGRRILAINHARLARLDQIEHEDSPGDTDKLAQVVQAFIEPILKATHDRALGGEYYVRLLSQVSNEAAEYARRISRDFFDPIARITIKALSRALPDLEEESLAWAYIFAVGAMVASISRTGRVQRLASGADPDDVSRIAALLIPFIAGGLSAVSAAESARKSEPAKRKVPGPKRATGPAGAAGSGDRSGSRDRRAAPRKKKVRS
jgi:AcrR family transcriptional regulator